MPDTVNRSEAVGAGKREVPEEPVVPLHGRPPKRESPRFDTVLHGYDRVAVDLYVWGLLEYVRGLLEENAALRRDLETGRVALRQPRG
jgi:hypothetical protein